MKTLMKHNYESSTHNQASIQAYIISYSCDPDVFNIVLYWFNF